MINDVSDAIKCTKVQMEQLPHKESSKDPANLRHDMAYLEMVMAALELMQKKEQGQVVELLYRRKDRIYILDEKVRGLIRATRLESYLIYSENPLRIYVKCTANSSWHDIKNVYPSREKAEEALKIE